MAQPEDRLPCSLKRLRGVLGSVPRFIAFSNLRTEYLRLRFLRIRVLDVETRLDNMGVGQEIT